MTKFAEEQKEVTEIIRKIAAESVRTLSNLEKEKKVSMFAVGPLRESLSKLEEVSGGLYKSTIQMISKNKREWEIAAVRKKKV